MHYPIQIAGDIYIVGDIVPDKFEFGIPGMMREILCFTGDKVVHAYDMMSFVEKAVHQMRADEAGATSYKYSHRPIPL